ncbi:MAG: Inositol-1-monophosphatase [Legionellaceae bacterium]
MHPMLNIAIAASRNAGKIILQAVDRLDSISVTQKKGHDLVTEVDIKAERAIIQTIQKAYPNHGILAEESGKTNGNDYTWIIDPLDGTTNFIHGFPHFCVSIALAYKNKLEQAVIYDPIRQELFTASRGNGAQLNNRRIRVSTRKNLTGALIGTGFPFKDPQYLASYLKTFHAFSIPSAGIRRAGSAALDLAYVAAGRLDGFWEFNLNPWDLAAGSLLIKEAGGLVSNFEGVEIDFQTSNIVAGNGKVFKEMLQTISKSLNPSTTSSTVT